MSNERIMNIATTVAAAITGFTPSSDLLTDEDFLSEASAWLSLKGIRFSIIDIKGNSYENPNQ